MANLRTIDDDELPGNITVSRTLDGDVTELEVEGDDGRTYTVIICDDELVIAVVEPAVG